MVPLQRDGGRTADRSRNQCVGPGQNKRADCDHRPVCDANARGDSGVASARGKHDAFDIGLTKKIPLGGSRSIEFRADVLNVFDNINFTVSDISRTPGTGAGILQTDSAYRDLDNTYDPGGRLGQIALRLNW